MTNEEINKYIHVEIMGLCWHEWFGGPRWECFTCGAYFFTVSESVLPEPNPNYCSDDSPRRLLNEVVTKIIHDDLSRMAFLVHGICPMLMELDLDSATHPMELNAEQIARACVEAHKEARKIK